MQHSGHLYDDIYFDVILRTKGIILEYLVINKKDVQRISQQCTDFQSS